MSKIDLSVRRITTHDGQGYSIGFGTDKARRIQWWLDAIREDRNYARILFGLPLIAPVKPGMRAFRDRFNRQYR